MIVDWYEKEFPEMILFPKTQRNKNKIMLSLTFPTIVIVERDKKFIFKKKVIDRFVIG